MTRDSGHTRRSRRLHTSKVAQLSRTVQMAACARNNTWRRRQDARGVLPALATGSRQQGVMAEGPRTSKQARTVSSSVDDSSAAAPCSRDEAAVASGVSSRLMTPLSLCPPSTARVLKSVSAGIVPPATVPPPRLYAMNVRGRRTTKPGNRGACLCAFSADLSHEPHIQP